MADEMDAVTPLDLLRRDGWHQSWFTDGAGRRCILGAMGDCGMPCGSALEIAAMEVVREQYPDRVPDGYSTIARFNDHPDTTFADVELVLEKAQLRLDEVTADV